MGVLAAAVGPGEVATWGLQSWPPGLRCDGASSFTSLGSLRPITLGFPAPLPCRAFGSDSPEKWTWITFCCSHLTPGTPVVVIGGGRTPTGGGVPGVCRFRAGVGSPL